MIERGHLFNPKGIATDKDNENPESLLRENNLKPILFHITPPFYHTGNNITCLGSFFAGKIVFIINILRRWKKNDFHFIA
ncbi:MAG: hypothetical protein ACOC2M_01630 [bacterium]